MTDASPPNPWSKAIARLRGLRPGVRPYAFGKHPAWADFIDVAQLPPVPGAFAHFHRHLRPAVTPAVVSAEEPALLVWRDLGRTAVLLRWPSRDRGSDATGRHRRSPLWLGRSAWRPTATFAPTAAGHLITLATQLEAEADPEVVTALLRSEIDIATAGGECRHPLCDAAAPWWPRVANVPSWRPLVLAITPGQGDLQLARLSTLAPDAMTRLLAPDAGG